MVEEIIRGEVERLTGDEEKPKTRPISKVSGVVTNPKKSPMKKFAEVFFEEDIATVKESMIKDVAVPTIKGFMCDMLMGFVERMFYGTSTRGYSSGARTLTNSLVRTISTSSGGTRYDLASRNGVSVVDETPKFSYKTVIMRDRASAQNLLDTMRDAIRRYGNVSVAELYDALDATDEAGSDYMDNKWGWTNLDNVPIKRVASGYWVDLPKPIALTK